MAGNHALIFGASGITGWAITNALINGYAGEETFSTITALTNRPLSVEVAQWPASQKLQVVSGLDLLTKKGQSGLEDDMVTKIKGIETVTHVYYFAYIMDYDNAKEVEINTLLLQRAINAVEKLARNLKFVVLPTGTKAYGVHLLHNMPFTPPLTETMDRLPEPHASEMFYYASIDEMKRLSLNKSWTWCEIIPDNIIGFVPNNNVYCLAQTLGTYLSLYVSIEGKGAKVPFPGNEKSWTIKSNESNQDTVAKFCIWASLKPKVTGGERFNTADSEQPSSWSVKWPIICEYFGLEGTPPPAGGSGPQPGKYFEDHAAAWEELKKKSGLSEGNTGIGAVASGFQYFIMTLFDFDRELDMTKAYAAWGDEKVEMSVKESWWLTFDRFRKAKVLP